MSEPSAALRRVTHGRHCTCSACAREDWTNPDLAPCGMHGPECPREYAPFVCDRSLSCTVRKSDHLFGCEKAKKDEHDRQTLCSAFLKLRKGRTVELYGHECDALYGEFCRLANFATLLGEPSPAEMIGYPNG